jgi:hypothetical protein
LLREGADSVNADAGLMAAGRLVDRRTAGRDFGDVDFGRDMVDFGFAVVALGLAVVLALTVRGLAAALGLAVVRALDAVVRGLAGAFLAATGLAAADMVVIAGLAAVRGLLTRGLVALDEEARLVAGRDAEAFGLAAGLRLAAGRGLAGFRAVLVLDMAGIFADDMVLDAAISIFAAVDIALVAVFIAVIADDIVLADVDALVAAAVIFVAAMLTLVAADDTFLAAAIGVAELRAELLRTERAALVRRAVERDAVDRDAVLRVDRDAVVFLAAELRAGFAAELLAVLGLAAELRTVDLDFGRLAVPLDALRLTDLLRAVLAELRRLAARVVD